MKAIIHIGTEKTGSTSIQELLYQNRTLLTENGYYFFQSSGEKNDRALPAYCLMADKDDDFFRDQGITTAAQRESFRHNFLRKFRKEMRAIPKEMHTAVISSEHFHSRTNTPEDINNLYELLSTTFSEFSIICYLRDQAAMCTSLYSTAIKAGHRPSFDKFLLNCNAKNIYYNYSVMLANWERSFGPDSLNVSIFSPDQFFNGDLLDDFTAKLDPTLVGTLKKNIRVENESLNYSGQVLGIAVNGIFPATAQEPKAIAMRNMCQRIIYNNCKGRGEQPPLDEQRRISDEFAESNEEVRARFFPQRSVLFKLALTEPKIDKSINAGFIVALSGILNLVFEGQESNTLPPKETSRLPDSYADMFRQAALIIEKQNLKLAFELMSLALETRPSGPFIKQKLDEYRQKLDQGKE